MTPSYRRQRLFHGPDTPAYLSILHPKWLRWQPPYLFANRGGFWKVALDGEKGKAF